MKGILIFLAGAGVGAGVTAFVLKSKYDSKLEKKASELSDIYRKKLEDAGLANFTVDEKPDINEAAKANLNKPYSDISRAYSKTFENGPVANNVESDRDDRVDEKLGQKVANAVMDYIYTISPDEFASTHADYEKATLQFYTDEILADEQGEPVNPNGTIGDDFVNHFDEFERDVVYIRNDKLLTDYEVIREAMSYEDYYGIGDD